MLKVSKIAGLIEENISLSSSVGMMSRMQEEEFMSLSNSKTVMDLLCVLQKIIQRILIL